MKKLNLVILAVILGFSACGDSKDSQDSSKLQSIDSRDSQVESSVDFGESQNIASLLQEKDIINGSFVKQTRTNKQYSWVTDTIYEGKGRISGVLVWQIGTIQDMEGWGFRELLFVPDRNSVFDE